jgi:hypothetical protein
MNSLRRRSDRDKACAIAAARQALAAALALLNTFDDGSEAEADPWCDPIAVSGLPRRAVLDGCRSGNIEGAVKVARKWRCRRSALDRWMSAHAPSTTPANDGSASSYLKQWGAEARKAGAQ